MTPANPIPEPLQKAFIEQVLELWKWNAVNRCLMATPKDRMISAQCFLGLNQLLEEMMSKTQFAYACDNVDFPKTSQEVSTDSVDEMFKSLVRTENFQEQLIDTFHYKSKGGETFFKSAQNIYNNLDQVLNKTEDFEGLCDHKVNCGHPYSAHFDPKTFFAVYIWMAAVPKDKYHNGNVYKNICAVIMEIMVRRFSKPSTRRSS
jgi:hypothetical protein